MCWLAVPPWRADVRCRIPSLPVETFTVHYAPSATPWLHTQTPSTTICKVTEGVASLRGKEGHGYTLPFADDLCYGRERIERAHTSRDTKANDAGSRRARNAGSCEARRCRGRPTAEVPEQPKRDGANEQKETGRRGTSCCLAKPDTFPDIRMISATLVLDSAEDRDAMRAARSDRDSEPPAVSHGRLRSARAALPRTSSPTSTDGTENSVSVISARHGPRCVSRKRSTSKDSTGRHAHNAGPGWRRPRTRRTEEEGADGEAGPPQDAPA